jgi:hypothetical protein
MLLTGKNIARTNNTPEVILEPEGTIILKGRSMHKNASEFYEETEAWIDDYIHNPAEITHVEIYLEYLNSASSLIISSMIRKISSIQLLDKKFIINWYYEEDDDDILAQGENISQALNIPFNFIMLS